MNSDFTHETKDQVLLEFWKEQGTLETNSDEEVDWSKEDIKQKSELISCYPGILVSKEFMNYLNVKLSSLKDPSQKKIKNFTNIIFLDMIKYLSPIEEWPGKITKKINTFKI